MSRPEDPLVGVAVPVLDAEPWLDALLASLRAQTYPRWRAVVVDDGSTDRSPEIAARHASEDARIRVSRTPATGPGARLARIHGRSLLPEAGLLYFPDADDVLEPTLLQRLVDRLGERPDAVAAFCRVLELHPDGARVAPAFDIWWAPTRLWLRPLRPAEDPSLAMLLGGAADLEAASMFVAAAFDEAGGLEAAPALRSHTFRDLVLRVSRLGPVVAIDEPLYLYRRHEWQASRDTRMLRANERALREHWRDQAASDPELDAQLREAAFWIDHRLRPYLGLVNARRLARRGRIPRAALGVVLAAARYRPFRVR